MTAPAVRTFLRFAGRAVSARDTEWTADRSHVHQGHERPDKGTVVYSWIATGASSPINLMTKLKPSPETCD